VPRAPERSDSQVEKNYRGADREIAGNLTDPGPSLPKAQRKEGCEQKEECAGDLKPDDAAYSAEGPQETADCLADAATGLSCNATGCSYLRLNLGDAVGGRDGLAVDMGRARGGLRGTSNSLAGNAPGNANADAQSTADVLRSHTVYDGSSGLRCFSRLGAGPGLLSTLNGSKVKRFRVATRIPNLRGHRSWR
jgi:hypothetical protein